MNGADSRGQDFRWEVSDIRWDLSASEELSHLVAEGIAVALKQIILVTAVHHEYEEETDRGTERRGTTGWRRVGESQDKAR